MGILEWFRKRPLNEVVGPKVLVCTLDSRFYDAAKTDAEVYEKYYRSTTLTVFAGIEEFIDALKHQYDVIHLLCDVSTGGEITDKTGAIITGTRLLEECCASDAKILWIASDNRGEAYNNAFKAKKRLNLVMTIQRRGGRFSVFLDQLLSRMSYGDPMPVAWVDIAPQIPGSSNPDAPAVFFYAGRGGVRLLR